MWTDELLSAEDGSPPGGPASPLSAASGRARLSGSGGSGTHGSPGWRHASLGKNPVPGMVTASRAPPRQQSGPVPTPAAPKSPVAATAPPAAEPAATPVRYDKEAVKRKNIVANLEQSLADLGQLRKLCWAGVPADLRPAVWRLLLGCVPIQTERRAATVARKLSEYEQLLPEYEKSSRSDYEAEIFKQIAKDVPRPHLQEPLLSHPTVQQSLSRLLYVWALRHPVVGYVQGFNDLVSVFLALFLSEELGPQWATLEPPPPERLLALEADAFFALAKLIDGMQDVFTNDRRGLFRMVATISSVVQRVDPTLAAHFKDEQINYDLFVVPWINCLLVRVFPLPLVWRLYDTYLSEQDIAKFHPHVCVAFLLSFSDKLKLMSFQEALLFLQHPPTSQWGAEEMEMLLSRAFVLQETFGSKSGANE